MPAYFGANLPLLQILDLSHNQLSGQLSTFLFLQSINNLNLSYNQLSGNVPDDFVYFGFYSLDLSHNQFTFDGMELIAQTYPLQYTINKSESLFT